MFTSQVPIQLLTRLLERSEEEFLIEDSGLFDLMSVSSHKKTTVRLLTSTIPQHLITDSNTVLFSRVALVREILTLGDLPAFYASQQTYVSQPLTTAAFFGS